jgi:hypothetical protein
MNLLTPSAGRALAILFLGILGAGCATGYHALGINGGFEDSRIDESTFLVSFRGNGYTSAERVETLLLYRCAEITRDSGFDYFVLLREEATSSQSVEQTPGHYTARTTGSAQAYDGGAYGASTTTGTYSPGTQIAVTRHGASARIRAFKGARPSEDPNAFAADSVLKYLAPQVRK